LALDIAAVFQPLAECRQTVGYRIGRTRVDDPDHWHRRLLRLRRKRPRSSGAAEQRYELAALHSITLSARASSIAGTSAPSILAVCRLTTSSNLVARRTGKSAGLSPLRMRPL